MGDVGCQIYKSAAFPMWFVSDLIHLKDRNFLTKSVSAEKVQQMWKLQTRINKIVCTLSLPHSAALSASACLWVTTRRRWTHNQNTWNWSGTRIRAMIFYIIWHFNMSVTDGAVQMEWSSYWRRSVPVHRGSLIGWFIVQRNGAKHRVQSQPFHWRISNLRSWKSLWNTSISRTNTTRQMMIHQISVQSTFPRPRWWIYWWPRIISIVERSHFECVLILYSRCFLLFIAYLNVCHCPIQREYPLFAFGWWHPIRNSDSWSLHSASLRTPKHWEFNLYRPLKIKILSEFYKSELFRCFW